MERVAGPPMVDRPISADFDDQGRLYVTESSGTNDKVEIQQNKALKKLRSTRDNKKVERALSKMQSVAEKDGNLMPYILDSVKVYATTGEISNTFREVFGEYRPKEVF